MLRSILIYLSKATWARKLVTSWGFAWRAASRFVAGETLQDGIDVIKDLNAKGINATLDHLGEHTTDPERAQRATEDILEALAAIDESGVRANVSVKLTQLGLALDEQLCRENLERILKRAQELSNFVRIDMEDSPWVNQTLSLYRYLLNDCGCDNVGVVIQSYLFRSEQDVVDIMAQHGRIRLCKGAYQEPERVAFPKKSDVDANYDLLARLMLEGAVAADSPPVSPDGKIPPIPALATHDEKRITLAKAYIDQLSLPLLAMEFQMLNGIRRDLQQQLAAEGYPVRVYVPYGTEWYPYFVRRLAERPANLWFFLSNMFRK
jgi:proline dehydrogenase